MTTNAQTYLTRQEFAALYRVSPRTVSKLIKSGKIPVVRLGRQIRILASVLPI